jgi:DNA repair exonuclease SbcCD ATPase subunit
MKIKTCEVRNLYSFKEFKLDLTKYQGVVRILGNNLDSNASNGSGKSAVIESIIWGIFGKTLRKSTEDAIVNIDAGEDMFVKTEIFKEGVGDIIITRTKRPTSLDFSVNGVITNGENAGETQSRIDSALETDYRSFVTSLAFGQHADKFFLDSTPEDKRKIIRNCFDLEELFGKRTAVKQLKSAYAAEHKLLERVIDKHKMEEEVLKGQVPDDKYKLVELPPLEEVLSAEKIISDNEYKIKDAQRIIKKDRDRMRRLKESFDKGVYTEDEDCAVCKSTYRKEQTKKDVAELEANIYAVEGGINLTEGIVVGLRGDNLLIKPDISSQEWSEYNLKNKLIENAQTSIDRLQVVRKELQEYEEKDQRLQSLLIVMKFWETAFSEKGLIRYIIRNILEYFNLKSNEYVSILTKGQFHIEFEDDLSETIHNNGRHTKYISLSGGEKRKVNLAIMLALQDLSTKISKTDCNLIFFDEVCDNLDNSGIEAVNTLLGTLRSHHPDKTILLITHNDRLQELLGESQYIEVTKEKGISRITHGN